MKIGYFADGPWSHRALEQLIKIDGIEISFITPRFEMQDPVLKSWSRKLKVPFIVSDDVNSTDYIDKIKPFKVDLMISMSFNQILKKEIISLPPKGFINCHAGALPFYRGRNPLNWVLINGESQFGITVHMVDEGIDTGDIISRKLYDITSADDYGSLLNKAVYECSNVLVDAVKKIKTESVVLTSQSSIHPVGFYCGVRKDGDENLKFNSSSADIFNFIRGITYPGPGARIFDGENEIVVLASEIIPKAPCYKGTVGEVVGRNSKGVVVKTLDSTILLTKVSDFKDGHFINERVPSFSIGTRFG